MEDIAAHNLLNRTLQEGWRVVEKKEKKREILEVLSLYVILLRKKEKNTL